MTASVHALVVAVAFAALSPHATSEQPSPTFDGRWVLEGATTAPSAPVLVEQSGDALRVENWSRSGPRSGERLWARIDGSASATAPATWQGGTLVVRWPAPGRDGGKRTTESWSLDTRGALVVVIETISPTGARTIESFRYRRVVAQGILDFSGEP